MKKLKYILLGLLFSMFIASCGTNNENSNETPKEEKPTETPKETQEDTINNLLKNVKFESETFNYDGKYHEITLNNLPDDFTVKYTNNKNKEMGNYDAKAEIYYKAKLVKTLEARLTISFNSSTIQFLDLKYEFDNTIHKPTVSGKLPKGVSMMYDYSKIKEKPGTYQATVVFTHGEAYNLSRMTCNVVVLKKNINLDELEFKNTFLADGNLHQIELKTKLDDTLEIEYENNSMSAVGEKTVKATVKAKPGYEDCYTGLGEIDLKLKIVGNTENIVYDNLELDTSNMNLDIANINDFDLTKLKVMATTNSGIEKELTEYDIIYKHLNEAVDDINAEGIYELTVSANINNQMLSNSFTVNYFKATNYIDSKPLINYDQEGNVVILLSDGDVSSNNVYCKNLDTDEIKYFDSKELKIESTNNQFEINGIFVVGNNRYKIDKFIFGFDEVIAEQLAEIDPEETTLKATNKSLEISILDFIDCTPEGYELKGFEILNAKGEMINDISSDKIVYLIDDARILIEDLEPDSEYEIRPYYYLKTKNSTNKLTALNLHPISRSEYKIAFLGYWYRTTKEEAFKVNGYYGDEIIYSYYVDSGYKVTNLDFFKILLPTKYDDFIYVTMVENDEILKSVTVTSDIDIELLYINPHQTEGPFKVAYVDKNFDYNKVVLKVETVNAGTSSTPPEVEQTYVNGNRLYTFDKWSEDITSVNSNLLVKPEYTFEAIEETKLLFNCYASPEVVVISISTRVQADIQSYEVKNENNQTIKMNTSSNHAYDYFIPTDKGKYDVTINYSYMQNSTLKIEKAVHLEIDLSDDYSTLEGTITDVDFFGATFKLNDKQNSNVKLLAYNVNNYTLTTADEEFMFTNLPIDTELNIGEAVDTPILNSVDFNSDSKLYIVKPLNTKFKTLNLDNNWFFIDYGTGISDLVYPGHDGPLFMGNYGEQVAFVTHNIPDENTFKRIKTLTIRAEHHAENHFAMELYECDMNSSSYDTGLLKFNSFGSYQVQEFYFSIQKAQMEGVPIYASRFCELSIRTDYGHVEYYFFGAPYQNNKTDNTLIYYLMR